jgi:hypothetical protein
VPTLDLYVEPISVINLPASGNLPLDQPLQSLNQVLLRRLCCLLRVRPIPGAKFAIIDTGAPMSVFPHNIWYHDFGWRSGRDFDELSIKGLGTKLHGQILGSRYSCRLARLRVPVELSGKNPKGDRLLLNSLVCQLADPANLSHPILGLWGGVFDNRSLVVNRKPGGDDLEARLEF